MSGSIKSMRDWIALLAGVAISLLVFALNPFNVDHHANVVLAVATLMVVWWVTEAIPMPVVALLPLILFPLFGVETLKNTSVSYGDSILFLFLGGFMIGLSKNGTCIHALHW
jgi:sodium-dependent dicarboxylate transporter 2/3/5